MRTIEKRFIFMRVRLIKAKSIADYTKLCEQNRSIHNKSILDERIIIQGGQE